MHVGRGIIKSSDAYRSIDHFEFINSILSFRIIFRNWRACRNNIYEPMFISMNSLLAQLHVSSSNKLLFPSYYFRWMKYFRSGYHFQTRMRSFKVKVIQIDFDSDISSHRTIQQGFITKDSLQIQYSLQIFRCFWLLLTNLFWLWMRLDDYIDVGDGCWRRNMLVTVLAFLVTNIHYLFASPGSNIHKISPISK